MAITELTESGFVFQIDEPERVKQIKDSIHFRKYFTESASIPDLRPPKLGIYIIGFERDKANMIALGVNTGVPTTQSARIKIKRIVSFPQVGLADIIPDDDTGQRVRDKIVLQNKVSVQRGTFNAIIRNLIRLNPTLTAQIEKLVQIANGIDFDAQPEKATIFSQQQDALQSAFKGFNLRRPGYEDEWEPDEYEDSLAYLDGFELSEHVTEDEITNHDHSFFPDFVQDDKYHLKTNVFTDGENKIFVTMANRNAIEDVMGVDLVYYNDECESFCLVQYKRMEKKSGKYVYYPSSDGNYKKDIRVMKSHVKTFKKLEKDALGSDPNKLYDNYRLFGSPFFFKFANSSMSFQPFQNKVISGYYVPFDMWLALVEENKLRARTLKASAETLTRHINTNEFCDLLKRGMVGSRRCAADAVVSVLAECLRGNRSAVFAYKAAP